MNSFRKLSSGSN